MWPSMGIASIVTIEMPQNMAPVMLYRGTSNSRAKGRKCSPTIVRSSGAMSAQRRVTTHVRVAAVKATPSAATRAPNLRQIRRPSDGRGCISSRTRKTARSITMLMKTSTRATAAIVTDSAVAAGDRTTSKDPAANKALITMSHRLPPAKPRLRLRRIGTQLSSHRRPTMSQVYHDGRPSCRIVSTPRLVAKGRVILRWTFTSGDNYRGAK